MAQLYFRPGKDTHRLEMSMVPGAIHIVLDEVVKNHGASSQSARWFIGFIWIIQTLHA